jgi:hypothetical protein
MNFKTDVAVRRMDGSHFYSTDRMDAENLVRRGMAEPVWEGRGFCGVVRLLLSVGELRSMYSAYQPRHVRGRPKPALRAPDSSTGDAGRGWTHGARRQAIIFWPRVHERMESGAVRAEPMRAEA